MAVYTYEARTREGKKIKGSLRAADRGAAQQELRRKNLTVTQITEKKPKKGPSLSAKPKEVAVMTRQLATMIAAGLTLLESLETLYQQAKDKGLKMALDDIIERVRGGSDLSTAMANHPKVFSVVYVNMVKAAEASGQLDTILNRLSEYLESSEELKREIKGATIYPAFSLTLILGITAFLVVVIIPRFEKMFTQMGMTQLPFLTEVLLSVGKWAQGHVHIVILAAVAVQVALQAWGRTKVGHWQYHWLMLNMPVFGGLVRKVSIARLSRTLATLLESGVNMLAALEIVAGVTGNLLIRKVVLDARDQVSKGKPLSEPLGQSALFPPIVIRMVSVGEKTGQLEDLLNKISTFFEQEVRATVKALTSILEPVLIFVMGFIVGTIVLAVFLPIVKLQQKLAG